MSFPGYPQQQFGQMPYRGSPAAYPQVPLPGYPMPRPRSGAGEATVTALLVIPLLVFVFLSELLPLLAPNLDWDVSGWWFTGLVIATGVYFVVLVLVRGRGAGRRVAAGALALLAGVIYAGPSLWIQLTRDYHLIGYRDGLAIAQLCAVVVLAVLAWGVARRRSPLWLIGMLPTALLAGVWAWVQDEMLHSWSPDRDAVILLTIAYYATIIAGALCCWAFDAMGSGRQGQYPVAMTPGMPMMPGQPGMPQQMYPQPGGFGYPPSGPAPGQGSGYNPMAR